METNEFKKELKDLLKKYDISLGVIIKGDVPDFVMRLPHGSVQVLDYYTSCLEADAITIRK